VVLGKDGWLYTDEEFNVAEDTEATLQDNLALIDHVRSQLAQNNVGLIIAVVPAKARVYPEHLGKRQPPALQRELYARLMAHIRQAQISAPELLPLLNEGKRRQPTFLRTDTHWTPFGAQLTAEAIAVQAHGQGLTALAPAKFQTQAQGTQSHSADLFNFLPLEPYFAWLLPQPDTIELFTTQAQAENDAAADLLGDVPAPQVALVGSSYSYNPLWNFAGFLKQALATDVANYSREGVGPFIPMLDYLKGEDFRNHPPKLVVWEIPERYVIQQADLKSGKAKQ
jgi:alginate O-acetyltransferase complex protein AlgJ